MPCVVRKVVGSCLKWSRNGPEWLSWSLPLTMRRIQILQCIWFNFLSEKMHSQQYFSQLSSQGNFQSDIPMTDLYLCEWLLISLDPSLWIFTSYFETKQFQGPTSKRSSIHGLHISWEQSAHCIIHLRVQELSELSAKNPLQVMTLSRSSRFEIQSFIRTTHWRDEKIERTKFQSSRKWIWALLSSLSWMSWAQVARSWTMLIMIISASLAFSNFSSIQPSQTTLRNKNVGYRHGHMGIKQIEIWQRNQLK